jgi:hypothetical protein
MKKPSMKSRIFYASVIFFIISASLILLSSGKNEAALEFPVEADINPDIDLTDKVNRLTDGYQLREVSGSVRDIMELGRYLSTREDTALAIIHQLKKKDTYEADNIIAELLFSIAAGDGEWRRKTNVFKGLIPAETICASAAYYLESEDPFVRAMADWAISTRVNWEANQALADPEKYAKTSWYKKWIENRSTRTIIENDYVKQAWALGIHRSVPALIEDASQIMSRSGAFYEDHPESDLKLQWEDLTAEYQKVKGLQEKGTDLKEIRSAWLSLRMKARELIINSSELDFDEILFAKRHANHSGENITNGAKSYINKPGGDICIKKGIDPGRRVKNLIGDKLGPGHMKGMDLWYDADKLVFSYVKQPNYYKDTIRESDQGFDDYMHGASEPAYLYVMNTRGRKLRQITPEGLNSDIEPAYLPNGDIVFASSRSDFGSQCSGHFFQNKKIVNMFRTSGDGSGLRAISNNKDFDRYPHIMDNGLVLFTRWEYQERHLWQTHNLWTSRPDGSMSEAIFKQHINNGPMSLRDARSIPGSNKLVAIGCGHHEWAQGAVFILDYQKGINENDGFRCVTPHITNREGGLGDKKTVAEGGVVDSFGVYQQAYPLSEKAFLVSYSWFIPRKVFNATNFGLYYIDVYGNKEILHLEPVLSSVYPMPFVKREKPNVVPDVYRPEKNFASIYVTDVYEGVPEVDRGEIRYLRIGHHTEWPTFPTGDGVTDYNHLHYTPSGSWARSLGLWTWSPARTFGIVPVREDGSAFFKAPSGIPVYFQVLDKDFLEVRRMRTFVTLQSGESRGCTGCHESRDEAPVSLSHIPAALAYDPSVPEPPGWGDTQLPDYEKHIQPIFDRHCASCHNASNAAGGLDFSGRKVDCYNQSYRTLFGLAPNDPTPVQEVWSRKLMYPEHENPVKDRSALEKMENNEYPGQLIYIANRFSDNSVTRVKEFGSSVSPLIKVLMQEAHMQRVEMDEKDWVDLVTWIDLNAPYWGSFVNKEPVRDDEAPERVFVSYPPAFSSEPYDFKIENNN